MSWDVHRTAFETASHTHAHSKTQETLRKERVAYSSQDQEKATTLFTSTHTCTIIKCNYLFIKYIKHPVPLHHPGLPSSAFPKPGQPTPTLSRSLFLFPSIPITGLFGYSPHSHLVLHIWLFGDPIHHQMLPTNNKIEYRASVQYNLWGLPHIPKLLQ